MDHSGQRRELRLSDTVRGDEDSQGNLHERLPLRRVLAMLDVTGRAADLHSALMQPMSTLRAPMKFADSPLIRTTSSQLVLPSRLSESRSYLYLSSHAIACATCWRPVPPLLYLADPSQVGFTLV